MKRAKNNESNLVRMKTVIIVAVIVIAVIGVIAASVKSHK